jgi:type II secretory ATPase GspE/PulE/Tfp pilus assembly ATPase PilB-like protein
MSTPATSDPRPVHEGADNRQKALRAELEGLADVVGPAPLVDLLLERAFQLNATDIHLDPVPDGLRVRLRVDGLLHDVLRLPETVRQNVVSRVKLLANMDLTERRHSHDGHIARTALRGERDVRVGSAPTIYGERLVLRLMPDDVAYNHLEDLGLELDQLELLAAQLRKPYGMIVVAGPVGSGKSTTLYACLDRLNDPSRSVTTIEDPVERRLEGINQIQVEPRLGFGFVEALRGVLRQDPNVLMVGEVRDPETAHIACRAGLTGVLVLSTIHANDAASVIDVLREYGIPPMFIADAVHCIISQRLIRKISTRSRENYHPDEAACHALGIEPHCAGEVTLVRGVPAEENFHTGYAGRTAVFEVMPIDRDLRRAILRGAPQTEIAEIAKKNGMKPLLAAARDKVFAGISSVDEMHRVVLSV